VNFEHKEDAQRALSKHKQDAAISELFDSKPFVTYFMNKDQYHQYKQALMRTKRPVNKMNPFLDPNMLMGMSGMLAPPFGFPMNQPRMPQPFPHQLGLQGSQAYPPRFPNQQQQALNQ
jgi:hypothetical protein